MKAYHLDLEQCLIAVIQEVFRLPAVDTNDAEEQLAAEPQSHDLDFLVHDSVYERVNPRGWVRILD